MAKPLLLEPGEVVMARFENIPLIVPRFLGVVKDQYGGSLHLPTCLPTMRAPGNDLPDQLDMVAHAAFHAGARRHNPGEAFIGCGCA
jgi:hypothetical protein